MLDLPAYRTVLELAAALMLGSVIGLERGWRERERAEGSRVAGLRTFALLGLFGGVLGVLTQAVGPLPAAMGLAGLSLTAAAPMPLPPGTLAHRADERVHVLRAHAGRHAAAA